MTDRLLSQILTLFLCLGIFSVATLAQGEKITPEELIAKHVAERLTKRTRLAG